MNARPRFAAVLALSGLFLAGCVPKAPPGGSGASEVQRLATQSAREAMLAEMPAWSLAGRLAVSVAGDGGSGRIDWRQDADGTEVRLSAPVTRQSWVLRIGPAGATLEGLSGGLRSGRDAETLLAEATGWPLPVGALAAWARGARAPGPAEIEFGPDGLPRQIAQQGWVVEYREWGTGDPAMPRRVFARRGDASVRLVVDRWGDGS